MKVEIEKLQLIHNTAKNRFEYIIGDFIAELSYKLEDNLIYLYHTGVPSILEGQGIAKKLVTDSLNEIEKLKYKVSRKSMCSYISMYFQRYPERQNLLEN